MILSTHIRAESNTPTILEHTAQITLFFFPFYNSLVFPEWTALVLTQGKMVGRPHLKATVVKMSDSGNRNALIERKPITNLLMSSVMKTTG